MEPITISSSQLDAPYSERWEILKPIMCRFYIDEGKKVKEIAEIMQAEYRFFASQNQYKRQFGIWNLSKALSSRKKEQITKNLQTRSRQNKGAVVKYHGHDQSKAMRRYLKDHMRHNSTFLPNLSLGIEKLSGHALQCGNSLFLNWNEHSALLALRKSNAMSHWSPSLQTGTPMSGVQIFTPKSNPSPSSAQHDGPSSSGKRNPMHENSSMMLAVREGLMSTRAHSFLTGNHMDLLGGMNLQEQIITTDWFHQFWMFSFRTARTWGRGPRAWNSDNLAFGSFSGMNTHSSSNTPAMHYSSPSARLESQSSRNRVHTSIGITKPSSECRWSIHIRGVNYERVASPPSDPDVLVDLDNEDTWMQWPKQDSSRDFVETLEENLESNNFSNINIVDLPLSTDQISKALKRTPNQLLVDAFGFSIMARNLELTSEMAEKVLGLNLDLGSLFPMHLAATYLDGSKTCCEVFSGLVDQMATGKNSVRKLYTNHLNHTVLDTLMISILKAHTSCTPDMVDDAFKKEHRFAGEEVDICGRWDADSDCIRQLQASGSSTIPQNWKHMFCHTSAQTMVHCLLNLFGPHWAPDVNTPSGIFLKRCLNETCGLKMQLSPLHTVVVTAVHLAQYGREGENLFGILACLLCLLSKGANPLLKSDISLRALLSNDYGQECSHSKLDPFELTQHVPEDLISAWPSERRTGWIILCHVLEQSQNEWRPRVEPELVLHSPTSIFQNFFNEFHESEIFDASIQSGHNLSIDESEDEETDHEESGEDLFEVENGKDLPAYCPFQEEDIPWHQNYFRKNKYLSSLWAAVQTELLTYRRLKEGDPWISENFKMESVLHSLETRSCLSIGLISRKLMGHFCRCGIATSTRDSACVLREDACSIFFSNLEDWSKTTFLDSHDGRAEFWYS